MFVGQRLRRVAVSRALHVKSMTVCQGPGHISVKFACWQYCKSIEGRSHLSQASSDVEDFPPLQLQPAYSIAGEGQSHLLQD